MLVFFPPNVHGLQLHSPEQKEYHDNARKTVKFRTAASSQCGEKHIAQTGRRDASSFHPPGRRVTVNLASATKQVLTAASV